MGEEELVKQGMAPQERWYGVGGGGGIRKGTVLPAGIPGGSSNFPHIDDSEGTPTGGDPSRCSGCGMLPRAPHDRPSLIPLALLVAHFFLLAP